MSESNTASVGGKVTLGCGALALLASVGVCLFGAFHVFLDPHGHISADEAAPALVFGVFCSLVSVVLAAVGAFFAFKKPSPSAAPGSSSPFPVHFLSGCGSLLAIVLSCSAFGAAFYGFSRVDYYEDRASEEGRRQAEPGYDSWGLGPYYYERQADDARSMAYGSICCGGTLLALFIAGLLGFVVLRRRHAAKLAEASRSASDQEPESPGEEPPPSSPGGFGSPPQGPPPPGGAFGSG